MLLTLNAHQTDFVAQTALSMVANWPSLRLETAPDIESLFHGIQTWHVLRYVDTRAKRQVEKIRGPRNMGVPLVAAPASGSKT